MVHIIYTYTGTSALQFLLSLHVYVANNTYMNSCNPSRLKSIMLKNFTIILSDNSFFHSSIMLKIVPEVYIMLKIILEICDKYQHHSFDIKLVTVISTSN